MNLSRILSSFVSLIIIKLLGEFLNLHLTIIKSLYYTYNSESAAEYYQYWRVLQRILGHLCR
jgi:hypothetical protein